jgi:hypothetical protein
MEFRTILLYLILAIAIVALVIAIVALVNANTANDNANKANNSLVNYTALPTGTVVLKNGNITASGFTTIYEIPIPTNTWKFSGFNMGVLGNVAVPVSPTPTAAKVVFVTYASINGGALTVIGASEEIDNPTVTVLGYNVNINGVVGKVNSGDTVVLYVQAQSQGGTLTVVAPPENSAAIVYGPVNV